jgi:lipopolysaccharide export LptBFGC system permease protein LptF
MSFGGLLKPMMQYGLNGSQMAKMVLYLLPAMQTYSLPIAALFATTIVYGRLSADNELTACRAGGISHMNMLVPAVVLALVLSITSLLCLCFVVPRFTLKVEKVAFDSLADMVKKRFERKHQITLDETTIFTSASVSFILRAFLGFMVCFVINFSMILQHDISPISSWELHIQILFVGD